VSFRYFVVLALVLSLGVPAVRGEQVPEYELKAEFLSRFATFIEWPQSTAPSFTIGVIGTSPFNGYLDKIASRKIKGRPVAIRYITDPAQIEGCDVVFIASSEKSRLRTILAHTGSKPILTVGDTSGYAADGVLINFYNAGETVHFEINEGAADHSGLKFSSKLLKLARVVEAKQ